MVSELALGNWLTHGAQIDKRAALECVHAAIDEGVTTFDTADVYAGTDAETILGEALADVRRESIEICTKVYWPVGPGKNDRGLSRKHISESVNASLRRLRTDHIDLYQAHRFDHQTPLEETLIAFSDVVRQGKALYIGVSEWTAGQIGAAAKIASGLCLPLVSNQPQYSMLWRVIEEQVIPASEEAGIGQIVWSPLGMGILTGKYLPGQQPPVGSRASNTPGGRAMHTLMREEILVRVQRLREVALASGLSMAQLAIAWVLQNPSVSSAIIGATRPEHVRENVRAAGVRLTRDTMQAIDGILEGVITRDPHLTVSPEQRP